MRRIVVHPLLVAAFPVLFVCSQNVQQFSADDMAWPALALLVASAALWALAGLLTRSLRKGAILASLFFLLSFSFTAARSSLPRFAWGLPGGSTIGPRELTLAAWALLFVAGVWLTARTRRDLVKLTQILNVAALVLAIVPAANIAWYEARHRESVSAAVDTEPNDLVDAPVAAPGPWPDIYYVIMDGYGRQDVLRDLYGLDTRDFTDWLKSKGFYVADRSTSNYPFTLLAVPTPLQMDYIEGFLPRDVLALSNDIHLMGEVFNHSVVARFLRKRGYRIVAFSADYPITDMKSADVYLKPGWFYDEFSNALIDMTPIATLFRAADPDENRRRHILFMFNGLKALASRPGPKFVFAHFNAPHCPYVFGRSGEPVSPPNVNRPGNEVVAGRFEDEYRRYYADELVFLNAKLRDSIEGILARSERPPVIVIQGDHGPFSLFASWDNPSDPALRERYSIFNVYYLPGGPDNALYPGITPVNSFRVVLNHVFGTRYPLLPDRNYMSFFRHYSVKDMTSRVDGGWKGLPNRTAKP